MAVGERMVVVHFPVKILRKWIDQLHMPQDGLLNPW